MGWLGGLLQRLAGSSPVDLTFVPSISAGGMPGIGDKIAPDECYVELYVESLRLEKARRLGTRFNGVVYTFVSLPRDGEANAHLAAISKPDKLSQLDGHSLDKVITVSKQMMGAVPWRGGPLSLELGLFSVKTGNLLTPILDYVTKVSSAAGVSFVGTVKPFLPLITEGMDLLAGQPQDTVVEVAVDTDIHLNASMLAAIVDAPKGSLNPAKLSVDPADRKLLLDGKPLDRGYCLFSIRRVLQKADYGEIPELREKYGAIQSAIRSNKVKEAQEALTAFRLATIASPDLIPSDARTLVQKAEQKVKDAFQGGPISRIRADADTPLEELSAIGLYD